MYKSIHQPLIKSLYKLAKVRQKTSLEGLLIHWHHSRLEIRPFEENPFQKSTKFQGQLKIKPTVVSDGEREMAVQQMNIKHGLGRQGVKM